jgi:putative membrane protein
MLWDLLPTVNACLNALSAVCLALGFASIRARRVRRHRAFMLGAFSSSVVFLVSYLTYHAHAGVNRFPGTGLARAVYLSILASHTVLAATVPVLAIITLTFALRRRFRRHRRIARWTWPIWMYVSVTGVVIYWMLYRISW